MRAPLFRNSEARLPSSAHTDAPWRIHELTRDFRVEDVWALPTPGGPDDFPRLLEVVTTLDFKGSSSFAVRSLTAIRMKLGALFGLDSPDSGIGSRVQTLRDRLPADLRNGPRGPDPEVSPFDPLYLSDNEWAGEIANRTVHGVIHLGWVPDGPDGYRGQLAILVKRNGLLGTAYMGFIKPFRHWLVYPALVRLVDRAWSARSTR